MNEDKLKELLDKAEELGLFSLLVDSDEIYKLPFVKSSWYTLFAKDKTVRLLEDYLYQRYDETFNGWFITTYHS